MKKLVMAGLVTLWAATLAGVWVLAVAETARRFQELGADSRPLSLTPHSGEATKIEPRSSTGSSAIGAQFSSPAAPVEPAARTASTEPGAAGDFSRASGWAAVGAIRDPDYAATEETWRRRGDPILNALGASSDDLAEISEEWWMEHRDLAWIRGRRFEQLSEILVLDPPLDLELAFQWEDETNRTLWQEHQRLLRAQTNLVQLEQRTGHAPDELATVRERLDQLRSALWSVSRDPAYGFLWDLWKELR